MTAHKYLESPEKQDMKKLLLFGHNLERLPKELFMYPLPGKLTYLDISNNKLTELPDQIGLLSSLQYLFMFDNDVQKITSEIKYLIELKELDLSRNRIESVPYEITCLKKLTRLNLSGNDVKIIPSYLLCLPNLTKLFLLRNPNIKNVPKDIVLQGLEAMRCYLNLSIKPYVSDTHSESHEQPSTESKGLPVNVLERRIVDVNEKLVIHNLVKLYSQQMSLINDYENQLIFKQQSLIEDPPCEDVATLPCVQCGRFPRRNLHRFSSTSEYGSLSLTEFGNNSSDSYSCYGNDGSFTSDFDEQNDSWSSLDTLDESFGETQSIDFGSYQFVNASREWVLMNKGVKLTLPKINLSVHENKDFTIDVICEKEYQPVFDSWSVVASPVVHLGPHGVKFYCDTPAAVTIPISVDIENDDIVECFTSDTDLGAPTNWHQLEVKQLVVAGSFVHFEVTHFSLFVIIVSKSKPKTVKRIQADVSGSLCLADMDKGVVEVNFQRNSLHSTVDASIELLRYDMFYISEDLFESGFKTLAGPVLSLGPNGCIFKNSVQVTVPLPKGKEMMEWHNNPELCFMCSQTTVGKKPKWKSFDTTYQINWDSDPCTVTFTVHHFTLFSVFWNILDVAVPEHLKLHASSHLPYFTFWVSFKAFMTNCLHSKQFGLCVVCYRFGNECIQSLPQYPLDVGSCKARKMRTGKVEIQLKSGMFMADETAGETAHDLIKVIEFTGHDFDTHFACLFNAGNFPDIGLFGKVQILPVGGNNGDHISFNLIKDFKNEAVPANKKLPSEWENTITKEIASLLSINDNLWQELALSLGYNRNEARTKFAMQQEPIQEMLADFMSRDGSPEEFLNALYKVARTFKLIPLDEMGENQHNRRLEMEQQARSNTTPRSNLCVCTNRTHEHRQSSKRKSEALYSLEPLSESKFDDIAGEIARSWKTIGRKLNVSEAELREIELNYQHSGEKEKAFQMLLTWREKDPENCQTASLYSVLCDSGMKYTAQCSLR